MIIHLVQELAGDHSPNRGFAVGHGDFVAGQGRAQVDGLHFGDGPGEKEKVAEKILKLQKKH